MMGRSLLCRFGWVLALAWMAGGGLAAPLEAAEAPHVVFMVGEDEYETEVTLPAFVKQHLDPLGVRSTFVFANADQPNRFDGLEAALKQADVLFISVRRRTPPPEQLQAIRDYLAAGKPLVGIRTASHAFALRMGEPEAGFAQWKTFDVDVLGCRYDGHLRNADGTPVATLPRAEQHPIMTGVRETSFRSGTTLYRSHDLAKTARPLLRGMSTVEGQPVTFPVAWTNEHGKSRIFYTSLGHKDDFAVASFTRMLVNAIFWCVNQDSPWKTAGDQAQPPSRDVFNEDAAGNEQVQQIMRTFQGKGETGDDSQPTPAEVAVKQFQVHDDFEIELVAAEPDVMQPLFMTWDERGRLWVVQYLQYPFPAGLKVVKYDQYLRAVFDKVPEPPPHHTPGADKITVYEDTNGDGRLDRVKDVITGLNIVSSVAVGGGGIWVLNPPYLLFYPDADGDDVPDGDPEVHLSGFGLEDTHSVANSLKWGPDGWLYGANGSTSTGVVSSAVTKNVAFKGQMIWRYHPRTKEFEIFAEGGGNTFSLEIDRQGRVFSGTNGGNTRGMHYVQGGYARKNWGKHGPLTNPFAFGHYDHMRHEGFEERFSQTFAIYEGGALPESYDGAVVTANSLHNRVLVSDLHRDTSTYRTTDRPPVVLSPDRWFRPVDVEVGPDGAIYLADWYDSRLTHVDPRDNWHKTSGRIYRLKAKGAVSPATPDLRNYSDEQLIELFAHPNKWFVFQAVRLLGERTDPACLPRLEQLVAERNNPRSLPALWAMNWKDQLSDATLLTALAHDDPNLRRWGARLVGDRKTASAEVAARLAEMAASEPEAQVRSQLASTAKRLPAAAGLPIVRQLVTHDADLADLHLPLLVWWAIEAKAESDREAVLEFFADPRVWSLPLVEQAVLDRLMQRYAMADGSENLETCARLLALAPNEDQQQRLMAGLMAAFRGRRIPQLPESLAKALDRYQQGLGQSDLALGMRLGNADAIRQALKVVADPKADLAERLSYIEILGQINRAESVSVLLALLNERESHAVKRVALEALANYDDDRIGVTILSAYQSRLPAELGVQSTAQRVLASRKNWTLRLLKAVDEWRIERSSIPLDIVQQMQLQNDPEVNKLIEKLWGRIRGATPEEKLAEIERVGRLARSAASGDLASGKALFNQSCGKCHTLFGEGGKAGPDLTGYERSNLDFMLLAIIDPSAAIREEYTNFAIITKDGRSLTGLIENQDTRTITLRGVDGQATLIDRDQVEELQALAVSLMPDGLLNQLTEQQVKDLFAYLMSRTPTRSLSSVGGNE